MNNMQEMLRVENLRTCFYTGRGVVKAVDGVSFSLARGRVIGIIGESGSGKSITSLSILRLVGSPGRIVGGRVLFEGADLLKISESEMRAVRGKRISMVFQEPMTALNPVITIGEQIAESIRLHLGYNRSDALNRSIELLESIDIPAASKRVRDYPHQLSGGMRQRVMIAMAISCNPDLVIADEPTTALDVTIQAQILKLINDLRERLGMAVVMVTHNIGILSELGGAVLVMYAGQVMEAGGLDEVLYHPCHPYTRGLFNAVPKLNISSAVGKRLYEIKGSQPSLIDMPDQCPFAPRCPDVMDICRNSKPLLEKLADDHSVACWLYGSGHNAGQERK